MVKEFPDSINIVDKSMREDQEPGIKNNVSDFEMNNLSLIYGSNKDDLIRESNSFIKLENIEN